MNDSLTSVRPRTPALSILGLSLKALVIGSVVLYGSLSSPSIAAPPHSSIYSAQHRLSAQSDRIGQMELHVLALVNQLRENQGLSRMAFNPRLSEVARKHSQQMATHNFYRHRGLNGETHRQRVEASGLQAALLGENLMKVTYNRNPVAISVRAWMRSPEHRENLLMPEFKETGVGIWKQGTTYYVTQLYMVP